jgi:hypothetical protein
MELSSAYYCKDKEGEADNNHSFDYTESRDTTWDLTDYVIDKLMDRVTDIEWGLYLNAFEVEYEDYDDDVEEDEVKNAVVTTDGLNNRKV